ncbi:glycerate kinase [Rothia sp. ZJ1223]|uniref:glycerate kinase n=1 Tax=Rothia sp. ZJ1223 TaxID=2811098 RepID=UPI0019564982|nr:glycerate kinase [Rothia sp. ZJ1223]MBM7051830.1 glycerate kinase [Rothia sp. ZJ1223]
MTVLIAVDKFKGSLTGVELSDALATGMRRVLGEGFAPRISPIADGGDGTVDAALAAGFEEKIARVTGPAGTPVTARYALNPSTQTAVIEVAEACGLRLMDSLDACGATTYGVGELILHAVAQDASEIVIGLGGSATTDAGAGMLSALGVRFVGSENPTAVHGGSALSGVTRANLSTLHPSLHEVSFVMASDVTNPLNGNNGAPAIYGPQKGASALDVAELDSLLAHTAQLVEQALKVARGTFSEAAGAGAAGGLGFACLSVLGATMRPGVDVAFELTGFHQALHGAHLVITGEGKFDEQTLQGKGPAGVAAACRQVGARVLAVCGACELDESQWSDAGFDAVYSVLGTGVSLEESLADPRPHVEELGAQIARDYLS